MKKLDRFILKSFLGPMAAVFFVVLFILVMQFLWLYIDELVGKGLGLGVILEFLGWGCCTIIPTALPLAVLLASMMTLGNLAENNELLAIKAAGISLGRVLAPMSVVAVLICIAAFFASNNLIPLSYQKIYTLRNDILRTKNEIKIPENTFYDGIDGYVLRIDRRDDESGMMHGVIVYNHSSNKGNVSLTLADSALMDISDNKKYLTFELFDGINYEETNTRKYRDTTLQFQKIRFSHQELRISLENYAFQKSDDSEFRNEVKAMNLERLRYQKDSIGGDNRTLLESHYSGLMQGRQPRYSRQLDTSATGIRCDFEPEGLCTWNSLEKELAAVDRAGNAANEMVSTLTSYAMESYQNNFLLRRIDEGIFKKFALALACFIFFFIGAPIGALLRKGGLGISAIISVLFFVLYWVIDVVGSKLARDGAVGSFFGVFVSSFVLLPIGAYLTWKAVNDSSLFNGDSMKSWFRKLKMKVVGFFRKPRIVYMGTPEFAVAPLEAILKKGYKVQAVVTVPDKASGRGLKVNESAVKKYAVARGIPVYQPEKLRDPEFIEAMKALKPDLFVVVAFRLLPREVWEIPRLGTFNLHAALLPQYRGAAPINWAVINGENVSGVTTFLIDDGVDTGNIMMREQVHIGENDTAGDLHDRLMEVGSRVVVDTIEGLLSGDMELRLQKSFIQGDEQLKPAPKLNRDICHIDWNASSRKIRNLIRGLSPYPAAWTSFEPLDSDAAPLEMKIYSASIAPAAILEGHEDCAPGTIWSDSRSYLAIRTADGALLIDELQLSGKKRMDVRSFLAGWHKASEYRAN